jgi:hypothetical protein
MPKEVDTRRRSRPRIGSLLSYTGKKAPIGPETALTARASADPDVTGLHRLPQPVFAEATEPAVLGSLHSARVMTIAR